VDMYSPTDLFSDYWGHRWGWTAGMQGNLVIPRLRSAGWIVEYARVEPWVYTHYEPWTLQAEHDERPLGHPMGPNSQTLNFALFAGYEGWNAKFKGEWTWKGKTPGSNMHHRVGQFAYEEYRRKTFLGPNPDFAHNIRMDVSWQNANVYLLVGGQVGSNPEGTLLSQFSF
jgi:hypothetical protein